jgi:hypothetical protein
MGERRLEDACILSGGSCPDIFGISGFLFGFPVQTDRSLLGHFCGVCQLEAEFPATYQFYREFLKETGILAK